MTIESLKEQIESNQYNGELIIFKLSDIDFIAHQYIRQISKYTELDVETVESIDGILNELNDIFGCVNNSLRVCSIDTLDKLNPNYKDIKNLFIISKKISRDVENEFSNYIITIPKLEVWQIKDFVYTNCSGVDKTKLDWLIGLCKNDIYRLDNEVAKIKLFKEDSQKYVFDDFIINNVFDDLSSFSIFDFTNAVMTKDLDKLGTIYTQLENIDIEPFGLMTILYNGFKKNTSVWLSKNPTPENTGLKSNQIWAIKNQKRAYNQDQLEKILLFLSSIDFKIKNGELSTKTLIDYILTTILFI